MPGQLCSICHFHNGCKVREVGACVSVEISHGLPDEKGAIHVLPKKWGRGGGGWAVGRATG